MAGIPRWPIASGDMLGTGEAPAWILLNDRSRLAVHSNSLIRFEDVGGELNVTVLKGFFEADLRPGSRIKVDAPGSQADADPEQSQERKGLRLPLRARSRFDLHGLPNSPCAADPSLRPPSRSLCSPARALRALAEVGPSSQEKFMGRMPVRGGRSQVQHPVGRYEDEIPSRPKLRLTALAGKRLTDIPRMRPLATFARQGG